MIVIYIQDEVYFKKDADAALPILTSVCGSYPIEQGTFVTPSRMESEGYSGTRKV